MNNRRAQPTNEAKRGEHAVCGIYDDDSFCTKARPFIALEGRHGWFSIIGHVCPWMAAWIFGVFFFH